MGGLATDLTIYILLAIEFTINFYCTYQTYTTKRNLTKENLEKLVSSVQNLVIGESLEIIIPIAYLMCFILAFNGPNADALGNVKNGYWQYVSVDDVEGAINNLLFLVFCDCVSLILAAIFLFFASNINLFHVYLHLNKEYGIVFSVNQTYLLEHLFCFVSIACALDYTFQFDWVLNEDKWRNIMFGNITTTNMTMATNITM